MKTKWLTHGRTGLLLLLLPISSAISGQEEKQVDAVRVTFCDLYSKPQKYAGKMVEVRALLYGRRDPVLEPLAPQNESCPGYMTIGLTFPQDVKPQPNFKVLKDESFRAFEHAWQQGMRVGATFEGRFDPVFVWRDHKRVRVGEGQGFRRKHLDDGRIVLRRVSDVTPHAVPSK